MSRGTGAELCAALHADARTARIPVIILTTLTTDIEMQTARASGCEALLVKPCLPEQLREEASRLIGESRRARHGSRPGRPVRPQGISRR